VRVWVRDARGRVATNVQSFRVADVSTGIDFVASGLEVTQSVQGANINTATRTSSDATSIPGTGLHGYSEPYPGVRLVAGKRTLVRLYPTLRTAGTLGVATLPAPPAVLRGYRLNASGGLSELAGSPLWPMRAPSTIGPTAPGAQRLGDGGYWFELPSTWSSAGTITLVGEVDPADVVPHVAECGYADCSTNDRYAQTGIQFGVSGYVNIATIAEPAQPPGYVAEANPPDDPSPRWDTFRTMMPFTASSVYVRGYLMSLDVSRIVTCSAPDMAAGICTGQAFSDVLNATNNLVQERDLVDDDAVEDGNPHDKIAGVTPQGIRSASFATYPTPNRDDLNGYGGMVEFADSDYAAAHETDHLLGLPHASVLCGGNGLPGQNFGEPWTPNARGGLDGLGIDTRDGSGTFGPGNWFLYNGYPTVVGATVVPSNDVMSYCPPAAGSGRWISTRYWQRLTANYVSYAGLPRRGAGAAVATPTRTMMDVPAVPYTSADAAPVSLRIAGRVDANGALHLLRPAVSTSDPSPDATGNSPWVAVAHKNANTIATLAANAQIAHDDPDPSAKPAPGTFATVLDVNVPPEADSVTISKASNPNVSATVSASPNAPTVSIASPTAHDAVAGTGLKVAWNQADADGDLLEARIAWSGDGGLTYRTVAAGIYGRNSYTVPTSRLWGTTDGYLEVSVNDGWHTTRDVVGPLSYAGHGPHVRIIQPLAAKGMVAMPADGNLTATGEAYDEAERILPASHFTWSIDGKIVARHRANVDLRWLDPGRHTLRLQVIDYAGRTGTDAIPIRVLADRPDFLDLEVPGAVSPSARTVRISLDVSQTATLRIGGRTWAIGSTGRTILVPITRGRSTLHLSLQLTDGGKTTRRPVSIRR
jgi:hypothetical protein